MTTVRPGYKVEKDETGLTKREREVLALVAEGLDGLGIAAKIGVTKQRVAQIIGELRRKGRIQDLPDGKMLVLPTTVVIDPKQQAGG